MNFIAFILDLLILAGILLGFGVIALDPQFLSSSDEILPNSCKLGNLGDGRPKIYVI